MDLPQRRYVAVIPLLRERIEHSVRLGVDRDSHEQWDELQLGHEGSDRVQVLMDGGERDVDIAEREVEPVPIR